MLFRSRKEIRAWGQKVHEEFHFGGGGKGTKELQ